MRPGSRKRYPVSGTVTYRDQPVKHGQIHFLPETVGGRSATGVIEDGWYSLTTMVPNDGAVPGKYQVTIVSKRYKFYESQGNHRQEGRDRTAAGYHQGGLEPQEPDPHQVRLGPILGADGRGPAGISNTSNFKLTD